MKGSTVLVKRRWLDVVKREGHTGIRVNWSTVDGKRDEHPKSQDDELTYYIQSTTEYVAFVYLTTVFPFFDFESLKTWTFKSSAFNLKLFSVSKSFVTGLFFLRLWKANYSSGHKTDRVFSSSLTYNPFVCNYHYAKKELAIWKLSGSKYSAVSGKRST